ncbi:MAG: bifunctional non-ous end joining protein LigD [Hyphomicrobiales bacterium]
MIRARSVPKSRRQYALQSPALEIARELKGIRGRPFPGFIEPALATLHHAAPSGDNWVHEIKFDGYRAQLHKSDAGTKMFTRRGYDWSDRFRNIVAAAGELVTHGVILDGEVIVPTEEGLSDFAALESELSKRGGSDRLVYYVFDILHLEVFDLRGCALLDRKRVLEALLENVKGPIKYSEHLHEEGPGIFRNACGMELEGIVSKRVDGTYQSGRTHLWRKSTCRQRETFHVVGWAQKAGKFDGLYLGRKERSKLVYAGKLERGFTDADKKRILEQLERLKTKKRPIDAPRKFPKATWVKPKVMVEAEYRAKTG